ncbi:MAG: toxin [Phycisphaerales bacterium]
MYLTFVESRVFTARWHSRQNDEALRALQNELLENPHKGDSIPGCGILRKVRFGDQSRGKGKRGGVRVIYVHTPEASRIDLVTVFGKDEREDLSKDEVSDLCGLARQLRREAIAAYQRAKPKRRGKP